jgi:hypothetical protein
MPDSNLAPEQESRLETLVELFIDRIRGLEAKFGHDAVIDTLKNYKLFFALGSLRELTKDSLIYLITQIQMQMGGQQNLQEQLLKEYVMKALGALGLTAGLSAAGKAYDQDVDIAAISTDQEMPVASPRIEAILGSTQQTIQSLTDMLASALKEIDNSIDFLAATETGGSLASVQGAQAQAISQGKEPVELKQASRDARNQD